MSSWITIATSTENYSELIKKLRKEIDTADAIVIGAGSGMSTSAGLVYEGERVDEYFGDFKNKYGIENLYAGSFYPFETKEEYWAWWARMAHFNRYAAEPGQNHFDLLELVKNKEYFVITTNVDHLFQKAGFDKERLFYTQGDYGLWQCAKPCTQTNYGNKELVYEMLERIEDCKIPTELIPKCPVCGGPMRTNLRDDDRFVQDEGWSAAADRYEKFLNEHINDHVLYLDLGIGWNTPSIMKIPFWRMTKANPKAVYACINLGEAFTHKEIEDQSILIDGDILKVLADIKEL